MCCHVNTDCLIVRKVLLTFGVPFTFKLKCQVIADKASCLFSVLVTWASASSHSCQFTTAASVYPQQQPSSWWSCLSEWSLCPFQYTALSPFAFLLSSSDVLLEWVYLRVKRAATKLPPHTHTRAQGWGFAGGRFLCSVSHDEHRP